MTRPVRLTAQFQSLPAALLAVAAAVALLSGCSRSEPDPAGSAKAPPAPEPTAGSGAGPLVIDAPAPAATAPSVPLSEADQAWLDFQESTRTPDPPEEWLAQEPAAAEIDAFKKRVSDQLIQAADKAKDFYTRYPDHEQSAEARRHEIGLLNFAAQLGNTNLAERSAQLEADRLKDPDLSEDDRLELRVQQLQRQMALHEETATPAALNQLEAGVRSLQKEFPKRSEVWGLMLFAAERWLEANEAAKARTLLKDVLDAEADEEIQSAARELQSRAERLGRPLEMKFTALDGREIDLQQMRGKVVLIDFWATWCRPCMAELPKLKAAYQELHPKGFEILGISFDRDRPALERILKQQEITWPQYLEPGQNENRFGESFAISNIPTLWLVDKKGVLRDLNARVDLAKKVEALLAE